jgi:hypothetical protein
LGRSAGAGAETISVNAMRTERVLMIVTHEIDGGAATKYRLQRKTIRSFSKLEVPLSPVQSRRNVGEES